MFFSDNNKITREPRAFTIARRKKFLLLTYIAFYILFFCRSSISSAMESSSFDLPMPSKYALEGTSTEYASKGRNSIDENGVLVFDYGKAYNNLGKWHNPFFIARYAHMLYNEWHNSGYKDNELKNKFLAQAYFLLSSNVGGLNGTARWEYPFENTYFGIDSGWISGIGQSHIAGVLFRAYKITGERSFADIAQKAIRVYFIPMSSGGVITDNENGLWIQEVASIGAKPFYILNGHITGLLGLIDVDYLFPDQQLHEIVNRGISAVRDNIFKFDAGFSSFYSLEIKENEPAKIAPRKGYNSIHAWQLEELFKITGDPIFSKAARLFKAYDEINDFRKAKGSTNPSKHGPSEAAGWYGNRYWSYNEFPSFFEVHMTSEEPLDGIFIGGHFQKASPRAFSVSILKGNDWEMIWETENNQQRDIYLSFANPVFASAIRLDIFSDNGNRNVALDAVMPVRSLNRSQSDHKNPVAVVQAFPLEPGFRKENTIFFLKQ